MEYDKRAWEEILYSKKCWEVVFYCIKRYIEETTYICLREDPKFMVLSTIGIDLLMSKLGETCYKKHSAELELLAWVFIKEIFEMDETRLVKEFEDPMDSVSTYLTHVVFDIAMDNIQKEIRTKYKLVQE